MRWWMLGLMLMLVGCASPRVGPPDIRYGEDACDECGMIINEARYAAACTSAQGEVHRFDDIDDMRAWERAHPGTQTEWVHDYSTAGWLPGSQAVYVRGGSLKTPMGHNLVAVDSNQAHELLLQVHGSIDSNTRR